jgi:predicted nucleic acid-binding Zn ribbon protein
MSKTRYMYKCREGHEKSFLFDTGTAPDMVLVECAQCHAEKEMRRVYTAPHIIFRGTGWGGTKRT